MRDYFSTVGRSPLSSGGADTKSSLRQIGDFGSNPGALKAKLHIPPGLAPGAPLVTVLHGCTQSAAAYDRGSGWSELADQFGFAVLYPEQQRANNANLCFNWFEPADIRRGSGEAASIAGMIGAVVERHDLDRSRAFITGLSAGGAMSAALLACYPEMFAGGAIIAGLPFACAASIPEAFGRMRGQGMPPAAQLAASLRAASDHRGTWPSLSVWQGTADTTVAPGNADAIVAQFRAALRVPAAGAARIETLGAHRRKVWTDAGGRDVIESYTIQGMGHGTPLDAGAGHGEAGPYMLDVGLSSTGQIARFWGLTGQARGSLTKSPAAAVRAASAGKAPAGARPSDGVGSVIEDALRKAGLLR